MKKEELRNKLEEARFPKNSYTLFSSPVDETLCIEYDSPKWTVFYSERGLKTNKVEFISEDAACDYFYRQLTSWFVKK
jgi:hypothetical protein